MMSKEAMKLALEALKKCHYYMINAGLPNQSLLNEGFTAYKALEEALAQQVVDCHATGVCVQSGLRADQPRAFGTLAQQEPVERGGLRFYTNGIERQHWKADGSIDFKDKQGNVTMTIAAGSITSPQPSKPLTDEQMFEMVEIAWRHGWASCRDAEYVGEEAEDERWGMVGAEVVQDIAAHGIKENT